MSTETSEMPEKGTNSAGVLPTGDGINKNIAARRTQGKIWHTILLGCTTFGIIILLTLLVRIVDQSFGYIATQSRVDPATLSEQPLEELSQAELLVIAEENLSGRVIRRLERDAPLAERSQADLLTIIEDEIIRQEVVESWSLLESLFGRAGIEAQVSEQYPRAELEFNSWLDGDFLTSTMSSTPAQAGIRTAFLGTLWMIFITMLVAFPLGVGASIYLEEYASDNWLNRIIQTNINNLAGVPSIIYGMLGLAIFVRVLEPLTQGRSVLSASLTMALLILPIIIISGQEAIRAVPNSLRQASYGLGATKWQTIWNHVLPYAFPGILTGTILSMSRAIGETAPLVVIGAATFISVDPSGPFSSFTAIPIQIYNWSKDANLQFRNSAGAAIIVLLTVLLTLNATAIILRDRLRRSL
ncbi:MAG: phosphate ABC transporter permease PstA [Chloroflexota bacterium]